MSTLTLIPLLPLLGFLVNGLLGRQLPTTVVSIVGCAFPALSFVATCVVFRQFLGTGSPLEDTLFTWAATRGFVVDAAFYFDAITAVMCLVITGIGTLIHVYSIGYMHGDAGYARYFAYLNLFLFFMLVLVLGKNLVMLFIGWEGVGLASYLLIGFWFQDPAKTAAGLKAFVVNRVGDTGFLLAAFLIWAYAGTLDFQQVNSYFGMTPPTAGVMTAIGVLLLVGACGKSAQIPLHVWLPDAMAGPTPVSALIHAATMVTAGVYLLSRMSGLFLAAEHAMTVVAWVGALTALAGATMGVTQYNLKKVLAYSTMSQIGLMVMACGVGAFSAGMFHLYTHAFFKACLFLAAGAVLHALAGEEDMRNMGGLARRLPFTFGVFLLGTLALCGLPPFAGFFSKDEILWAAYASERGSVALWLIGMTASFLTAFYMFRAVFMTFFGASRVDPHVSAHIHDAPPTMASVLAVLALGSIVAGFVGLPALWREAFGLSAPFYDLLAPVLGHFEPRADAGHTAEVALMVLAVLVGLAGIAVAWLRYGRAGADLRGGKPGLLHETVSRGYYFDAFYDKVVVRTMDWLSDTVLARRIEAPLTRTSLERPADAGARMNLWFTRLQSGDLQTYVIYALIGLAIVLGFGVAHG
ncbi:MAG TPA: NADH-quinone oxidoreductase subunit L [Steroidobacteraceae bacterium]|nr:NADH-quinone oxidoreductase subunit L [Steroidobacteraceae bacterium]